MLKHFTTELVIWWLWETTVWWIETERRFAYMYMYNKIRLLLRKSIACKYSRFWWLHHSTENSMFSMHMKGDCSGLHWCQEELLTLPTWKCTIHTLYYIPLSMFLEQFYLDESQHSPNPTKDHGQDSIAMCCIAKYTSHVLWMCALVWNSSSKSKLFRLNIMLFPD